MNLLTALLGQLPIKQVLRNKYYSSCRTKVVDKRVCALTVHTLLRLSKKLTLS